MFKNRSFRLYFCGQLISFTGTWLQQVAQGWLVWELTHSKLLLGVIGALTVIPTVFLAPVGGLIADKFKTKTVIQCTQWFGMGQALIFWALVSSNHITPFLIICLALVWGLVNAADAAARQTYITEIVGRENIAPAMALNELLVSFGFIVGPSIAGILIATFNVGIAFLVNAVSFIPMIIALSFIRYEEKREKSTAPVLKMFEEGARYTFTHKDIRRLILLVGTTVAFGFPIRTVLPAIAREILHEGPVLFGWLSACPGIGTLVGGLLVLKFSKRDNLPVFIILGNIITGVALMWFSATRYAPFEMLLLVFSGMGLTLSISSIPAMLRGLAEQRMLGRVIGFDVAMFFGGITVGNFAIGYAAEHIGLLPAIGYSGMFLFFLQVFPFSGWLWKVKS